MLILGFQEEGKNWLQLACFTSYMHLLPFQIETPDVNSEDREAKMFPDQHPLDINITAHALTTDFLIYTSDVSGSSSIEIFEIQNLKLVSLKETLQLFRKWTLCM
jgi:hypothetical protein